MRFGLGAGAAVVLMIFAGGCSSDNPAQTSSPTPGLADASPAAEDAEIGLAVILKDRGSADVLFNLDDYTCSLNPFATDPTVEVTARDADGTILGTETLPDTGGSYQKGVGCTWPVQFSLPESDIYEVTVASEGQDVATATVQRNGASATVDVNL